MTTYKLLLISSIVFWTTAYKIELQPNIKSPPKKRIPEKQPISNSLQEKAVQAKIIKEQRMLANYYINSNKPFLANTLTEPSQLWKNGLVPFEISPNFSDDETKVITGAMNPFHMHSCVRFVPRHFARDYIYFDKVIGCQSDVGRMRGRQVVSLNSSRCIIHGTIMHELMHVLGFYHEQEREDRDSYINILWQNISPDELYQFRKHLKPVDQEFSTMYDYVSIMHYDKHAFSSNGQPTIETKKGKNIPIGQRSGFSLIDLLELNVLYRCRL